jgi:hypothetical protein
MKNKIQGESYFGLYGKKGRRSQITAFLILNILPIYSIRGLPGVLIGLGGEVGEGFFRANF